MKERLIAELSKIKDATLQIDVGAMENRVEKIYNLETYSQLQRVPAADFDSILAFLVEDMKSTIKKIHAQWPFVTKFGVFIHEAPATGINYPAIRYVKAYV